MSAVLRQRAVLYQRGCDTHRSASIYGCSALAICGSTAAIYGCDTLLYGRFPAIYGGNIPEISGMQGGDVRNYFCHLWNQLCYLWSQRYSRFKNAGTRADAATGSARSSVPHTCIETPARSTTATGA
eukprot:3940781-Rhodomonas_salina.1